jgi:hypothetical protein
MADDDLAYASPADARPPRPRAIIENELAAVLGTGDGGASAKLLVELLCDVRDLLGECAVRLSEIESHARR